MDQIFMECLYLVDGPESEAAGIDMDQAVADMAVFPVGPVPLELLMVGGTITEDVADAQPRVALEHAGSMQCFGSWWGCMCD